MVDAENNGIREKGCQHLSKLENERVERIDLDNSFLFTGRDVYEGKNRVGAWGKRCLEVKAKKVDVIAY